MIALEYAKSLFELANQTSLKELDENLGTICIALDENPDAIKLFTYPNISKKNKKEILNNISFNSNDLLTRFLYVLIDNDRFDLIYEIKDEFHKLVSNDSKVLDVVITSAKLLNNEQLKQIEKLLSSRYEGKKININNIIDENIIGGIKTVVDGKQIDLTIRTKLNTLKSLL